MVGSFFLPFPFTYAHSLPVLLPNRLLRGLNSIGWAYERLARPAARIRLEIDKLERRHQAYWLASSTSSSSYPSIQAFDLAQSPQQADPWGAPPMFSEQELQELMDFPIPTEQLVAGDWQSDLDFSGVL